MASGESFYNDLQKLADVSGITPVLVPGLTKTNTSFWNISYRTFNGFSFSSGNYDSPTIGDINATRNTYTSKGATGANYYMIDAYANANYIVMSATVFDDDLFLDSGALNPNCVGIRIRAED